MLHRPYIRQEVRQEVEKRAQKNDKGQFLDANTHKPIDCKYDLGHKPGHEFWREAEKAEKEGLTQEQFNSRMNNPDLYHIESPHENRSHSHEMPKSNDSQMINKPDKGGKTMDRNEFINSIKVSKTTVDNCNQVSKNAAKTMNNQSGKKNGQDNGGRERGDNGPMSHGREGGNKGGPAPTQSSSNGGHNSNGQAASSGHSSAGTTSGGGHSNGGGHGSAGQGNGGHGGGH